MKIALSLFVLISFASGHSWAGLIEAQPSSRLIVARDRDPLDEDNCPPQTIVSLPITLTGNTSTAAHNFDLSCAYTVAGDDIYALYLSCDYDVTVSLCGSGYDTMLGVYHASNYYDCPGTAIACNDDYAPCGLQSQLTFPAAVGEYYFIVVSGYNTYSGAYTLNVSGTALAPNNDHCAGARGISSLPYQDFGSTACANNSFTPPCGFSNAPDVIYRLNLPCSGWITATTCGHPLMDALLWVYKYGACPGTDFVACNDDYCANNQSWVRFYYEAGQDYYIIVDGYDVSAGYYVLHVEGDAEADSCYDMFLPTLPVTVSGDTRCSDDDFAPCGFGTAANEDIYAIHSDHCQEIMVTLCGSSPSFDPVLEIRTGDQCPGDSIVACVDDDYCNGIPSLHPTAFFLTPESGWGYWIVVSGYYGSAGAYTLTMEPGPCELAAPEHLIAHVPEGGGGDVLALYWDAVPGARSYHVYVAEPGPPELVMTTDQTATYLAISEYPPNPCVQFEVTASSQPPVPLPGPALNSPSTTKLIPVESPRRQIDLPPWVRYEYAVK